MKTNQIITLGLVAIGAVIVYNKFIKKPTDSSTPEDGEMSNAAGLQYSRSLSDGRSECCYGETGDAWSCYWVNGPCPSSPPRGGSVGGRRRPKMDARLGF